jgi:hypothetical protein
MRLDVLLDMHFAYERERGRLLLDGELERHGGPGGQIDQSGGDGALPGTEPIGQLEHNVGFVDDVIGFI